MIQTNTEQYRKNYIAFSNAVRAFIAKNGKNALTAEVMKSILQQAQTKFRLIVRNGKVIAPTKTIARPAPQTRPQQTKKPQTRPIKAFWMP